MNAARGDPSLYLPVLHAPGVATPIDPLEAGGVEMNAWDPEGDVLQPDDMHARQYAPRIERAPPYARRMKRVEDLPELDNKGFFDTPAAERFSAQLGFEAHAVIVDNYSNQWIWLPSARRFVPPCMWGVILPLWPAVQVAEWHVQTPAGHAQGALGTVNSLVVSIWYAMEMAPNMGLILTI